MKLISQGLGKQKERIQASLELVDGNDPPPQIAIYDGG
jgi:hypothetical protein